MSGTPFNPDAYLAKVQNGPRKPSSAPFDPDAYLAKKGKPVDVGTPGSPLERALAEQSGDVVTVQTPTGPAQFTRSGARFYGPEEAAQLQGAGDAKLKEKALESGLSFFSGGGPLMDELAGAGSAIRNAFSSPGDAYRKTRDQTRRDVADATRRASPQVAVAGVNVPVLPALGAAVPSMLAPLPGTAGARILSSAVQGMGNAAAASEADLTRGEVGDFAKDVGIGGGTGLATSAMAEGVTAPLRAIARGATREAAAADKAALDALQAARDKALRSAQGSLGGVATGGMKSIEHMEKVLANPKGYGPEVVAAARAMRALPETQQAMDRAALGSFDKFGRFIPDYEAAELARNQAIAAASPGKVAADTAAKLELPAVGKDVGRKFMRSVGQRAALSAGGAAVGSAISELTGGDWRNGGMLGAGSGWATPGVLQFARNTAASPVVQSAANRLMASLLRASSSGVESAAPVVAAAETAFPSRLSKAYAAMLKNYGLGDEAR